MTKQSLENGTRDSRRRGLKKSLGQLPNGKELDDRDIKIHYRLHEIGNGNYGLHRVAYTYNPAEGSGNKELN